MQTKIRNQSEELLKSLERSEQHIKDLISTEGTRINDRIDEINQRVNSQNHWIASFLALVLAITSIGGITSYFGSKSSTDKAIMEFKDKSKKELEKNTKALEESRETVKKQAAIIVDFINEKKLSIQEAESELQNILLKLGKNSILPMGHLAGQFDSHLTTEDKSNFILEVKKKNFETKNRNELKFDDWRELALVDFLSEKFDAAHEKFEYALTLVKSDNDISDAKIASTILLKAAAYARNNQDDYETLIKYYNALITQFGKVSTYQQELRIFLAEAMFLKSYYLAKNKEYEDAQNNYREVIVKFGNEENIEIKKILADAWFNLGRTFSRQGERKKAIEIHQEFEELFKNSEDQYLRERIAMARLSTGYNLLVMGKSSDDQIERKNSLLNESIVAGRWAVKWTLSQDRKGMALGNIGYAYFLLDEYEKARTITIDAFYLGGKDRFCGQLSDANTMKDRQYKMFIEKIWKERKILMDIVKDDDKCE